MWKTKQHQKISLWKWDDFVAQRGWAPGSDQRLGNVRELPGGDETVSKRSSEMKFHPLHPGLNAQGSPGAGCSDAGSRDVEVGPPAAIAEADPARPRQMPLETVRVAPVGLRLDKSISLLLRALVSFPIKWGMCI